MEQDSSAVQVIPWDTVENIKMNNAFLVKAENTWTLKEFCISQVFYDPYTWMTMIRQPEELELVTEDTRTKRTTLSDRGYSLSSRAV
jgi:hypothetical protein